MNHPLRLLAAGLSTALVTGAATAAMPAGPVHAETVAPTAVYSCVPTLVAGLVPLPAVDVPVRLDVADTVPAVAGGTLAPLTGTLGLDALTASIHDALGGVIGSVLFTVDGLRVGLDGTTQAATVTPGGVITVPALQVPDVSGSFPLTLPHTFDIAVLGGLLGSTLASTRCVIEGLDDVITTVLVGDAAGNGDPGAPGGADTTVPGGATQPADPTPGPSVGGSPGTAATPVANPCLAVPAARAGQRRTRMTVGAPRVTRQRRPTVGVSVKAGRRPARGRVIACSGAVQLGARTLRRGHATLRTARLRPGRHLLRVVYLGSATARPKARTITLRVRH